MANAVVSELVELPWTAHLLPHILENLVDIPLSAQQAEAVRAKLSTRTLDADGTALAKQLLHFCEQRGAEWAGPFRRALSKVHYTRLLLLATTLGQV